jgi:hypothetical protein
MAKVLSAGTNGTPRHGYLNSAAIGVTHAGNDRQHRRLSGAVGTDQPVHTQPLGTRKSTSNKPMPP